jgi:hypothetical protein
MMRLCARGHTVHSNDIRHMPVLREMRMLGRLGHQAPDWPDEPGRAGGCQLQSSTLPPDVAMDDLADANSADQRARHDPTADASERYHVEPGQQARG